MYFYHTSVPIIKNISTLLTLLLIMVICTFHTRLPGQQVVWANKNNLDKKTDFTKIIGQNKNGVYALKHRNSTFRKYFILEKFDKKMNLLHSKTIKIPNAELQKIIVLQDDVIFFTKIYEKGNLFSLAIQHLDSSLNTDLPRILIANCTLPNSYSDFKIEYNQDKSRLLAWYINAAEEETILHLLPMDHLAKGTMLEHKLPYPPGDLDIGKTIIDMKGNFYALYTVSKNFKSSKSTDFNNYLLCIDRNTGKTQQSILYDNASTFISNYDLSYNTVSEKVHATGFYGDKDEDDNAGYFDICINTNTLLPEHQIFNAIDRKTVAAIVGAKYEQKGENLNKFKIRKTIPKVDGGSLIVSERSFITTQSDVFYVNGMPQTSYAKIFNNDELLLISIDSSGKVEWMETVIKNQSSINDGGFFNGIIIMVNDNNVNIIYNDRLSANADVIQITYKPNGEHTKKILLNSDQYYALIIPAESNQVSSNSIVLPINQNRDYTYIKLIY